MSSPKNRTGLFAETRRGIQASLRNNSAAFGYTVVVTCVFSLLQEKAQEQGLLETYLFITGAVAAFGVMEAVASNLFRDRLQSEPSDVVALGSTFSVISIGAAVGVGALAVRLLGGHSAWVCGAFASTTVYLVLGGLEMAIAQRIQACREEGSDPEPSEPD